MSLALVGSIPFETSAPCSAAVGEGRPSGGGAIWPDVNGERRQTGDLSLMIWNIPNRIEGLWELKAGYLIRNPSRCRRD